MNDWTSVPESCLSFHTSKEDLKINQCVWQLLLNKQMAKRENI